MNIRHIAKTFTTPLLAVLLSACGGVEGDIEQAFRQKYEEEPCLELGQPPFSVKSEDLTGSSRDWAMVHALEREGLFTLGEPVTLKGFLPIQQVNVDLTRKGRKVFQDGKLCYGKTRLQKIVDYRRDRQRDMIEAEALVEHDFEDWARSPEFEQFLRLRTSFSSLPDQPGEE
jgi:hypothetical protein